MRHVDERRHQDRRGGLARHQRLEALAYAADRIEAAGSPVDAGARERAIEHEDEAVGRRSRRRWRRRRRRRASGSRGERRTPSTVDALELRQDLQPGTDARAFHARTLSTTPMPMSQVPSASPWPSWSDETVCVVSTSRPCLRRGRGAAPRRSAPGGRRGSGEFGSCERGNRLASKQNVLHYYGRAVAACQRPPARHRST